MSRSCAPGAPGQPRDTDVGATEDEFEIAVEDLRREHGPTLAAVHFGGGSPLVRRLAWRARLWRQAIGVLLVLLVLPSLFPDLHVRVLAALLPPGGGSLALVSGLSVSAAPTDPLSSLLRDPRWTLLEQRPLVVSTLALGAPCPAAPGRTLVAGLDLGQGAGPVYATAPGAEQGALALLPPSALGARGQGWSGQKVVWYIDAAYQGPVLIRGRRLDGPGQVRFNGGLDQVSETGNLPGAPLLAALRLEGDSSAGEPWPGWPSYTRVRAPGCYAYQVDGLSFTEIIVFQAMDGV